MFPERATVPCSVKPVYEVYAAVMYLECGHSALAEDTAGIEQAGHNKVGIIQAGLRASVPGVAVRVHQLLLQPANPVSDFSAAGRMRRRKLLTISFNFKAQDVDLRQRLEQRSVRVPDDREQSAFPSKLVNANLRGKSFSAVVCYRSVLNLQRVQQIFQ